MHILKTDECELEEHEKCTGMVYCEECAPRTNRPCACDCGHPKPEAKDD